MARKSTPSFVLELPLQTATAAERVLAIRLDAARNIYNACLGEALRRGDCMREAKAWQAARKRPKGPPGSQERQARAKAFKEICAAYGFTSGDIQRFAQGAGIPAGSRTTSAAMIRKPRRCVPSARSSNTSSASEAGPPSGASTRSTASKGRKPRARLS